MSRPYIRFLGIYNKAGIATISEIEYIIFNREAISGTSKRTINVTIAIVNILM